jgi:hypothetical protein
MLWERARVVHSTISRAPIRAIIFREIGLSNT